MTRPSTEEVFIDSNCLSYAVDAMWGVEAPTTPPIEEKVALIRAFFYGASTLWTTVTVRREFELMPEGAKLEAHRSTTNVLFGIRPPVDPAAVEVRARELLPFHDDFDDCLVLAEVEGACGEVLLTFDGDFIKRLGPQALVRVMRPTEYWKALAIPRGARPRTVPRFDSPLAAQDWWQW